MKLLMISTDRSLFDPDSAVRARILEQASLVDEMSIIVFAQKDSGFKDTRINKHVMLYPTNSQHKFFYLFDAFSVGRKILKHAKGQWLISTQDPFETGAIGYLLSVFYKRPLHLQLHTDPFSHAWKSIDPLNTFRVYMAAYLLHRAQSIRVVSTRAKKSILKIGVAEELITQVPIFVDVKRFLKDDATFNLHQSYPAYDHIILSMGRLTKEKNFSSLIRAFAKIRATHEDALLLIVGSGPERERLMSLAQSLDIDRHVHILPWARDVISYYKTADVYVQSSLYEGWGLSVIEAMAAGCPVVMTDVGCAGEMVINGQTGLVVPVGSDTQLGEAIKIILGDENLRKNLIVNAKDAVCNLATKNDTLRLYKESWAKSFQKDAKKRNEKTKK